MNQFYKKSLSKILAYIDKNPDGDLSLASLAQLARISKFHFHRIFKTYMGLSLGDYVKLKRLEKGLWQIIKTEQSILEIALDSGYDNHSAFSRAFQKEMGCSPKEFREQYKKNKELLLTKLHKNKPKFEGFEERKETPVLFLQKKGSYYESAPKAWGSLLNLLEQSGLDSKEQTYFGLTQDDPNEDLNKEELRFNLCLLDQGQNLAKLEQGFLPAGSYAVFSHNGPMERLADSYYFIYGQWLSENELILGDLRPFFEYINPFSEQQKVSCKIYFPINKQ